MKIIIPKDSPKAGGHYSPGVISNGMLYISGQLPVDPETGNTITGDVSAHALRALQNMELILIAAGLSKKNVVLCRVYISDVALWANVNSVYASFFGDHRPARVVVPSRSLHGGALVEVEAMAELEIT
ncbi:MAG: Rid family detoxifying hydrolase [Clostridiaceae bacterium]